MTLRDYGFVYDATLDRIVPNRHYLDALVINDQGAMASDYHTAHTGTSTLNKERGSELPN
ncbi:hypothetical protein BC477_02565 [Clavibacter michiganensis subsp. michiganensis]|uniref:Uncharacterized protein n=2 Tax=Clavibacter michiganensis subsp. michiganensis TaxID=33013 RepID=A0A251XK76_CLAMM|nr:hypothetical protein [Clavibacter michiganensis]OUD86850.1 hypothetical protein BC477_02565 [Clavibacter michiganensis subsp. michiganensis]OUE03593.1 hypothetical protein CMMCAS07_01500 [Clavibacter michiganensis subsp. michiganensis]CAN02370.1 hypothetical protein CMM_2298 [Clavibacter michiganensis subsp. michiganensis NCPPB 382]